MTSLITRIKIPTLFDKLSQLNTNQEKRDLMAAGCAAGVSAAFGSPVGARDNKQNYFFPLFEFNH